MRTLSKQNNPFHRPSEPAPRTSCSAKHHPRLYQQSDKCIKIGKYKILLDQLLGKGYSSRVYKGVQQGKQLKKYAIKVIQLKGFSPTCLKLFQREIEIHKTLDHEHIVRCYDVLKTKTHIYMVMEYCPHGDLSTYIKQKKKLPEHSIVDIMSQVINGYRYLTNKKILHRDLKPTNIMRSGKIWKIADFGFAIKAEKGFVDDVNVGTPMYMPVQSLARSYYSIKSDVFALGVILYELLHGKTPWFSKSEVELLRKMCNNKLKIEKEVANAKIRQFIVKACEINEDERMNAAEFQLFSFTDSDQSCSPFLHSSSYSCSSQPTHIDNNTEVLLSQLNLCKFLYYMVQNIECFLLSPSEKNNFLLILLKLLLKIIKGLEDERFTTQRLIKFDEYKTSSQYQLLLQEIKDHSWKYEKTYLDHIKATDIQTIRSVNHNFPEFTKSSQLLDSQFYLKLRNYLQGALKESNRFLSEIVSDDGQQQSLPQKIEAFQSMTVLYRFAECRSKHQPVNFKTPSLARYSSSPLRKSDYLNLRRQLKYL